ncbi:MAG: MvdC/MvdD family ATP grasp protein [Candidatus Xenobia bacterium]
MPASAAVRIRTWTSWASLWDQRGVSWFRFPGHAFPSDLPIALSLDDGTPRIRLHWSDEVIDFSGIRSIWYRRTAPPGLPADLDAAQARLARGECRDFLAVLWGILQDRHWVCHPTDIRNASCQAEQLLRAAQLGLTVPRTLISNDPDEIKQFFKQAGGVGKVLYKPHQSIILTKENEGKAGVVYSSLLDESHLALLEEIRLTPGIFQEYQPKAYEVRVTVVGAQAFGCRIDSQTRENTRIDWRDWDWTRPQESLAPHSPMVLPEAIHHRVVELTHSYRLRFSTMDFVVRPDGRWVFLEVNPNGQWAWIESLTGIPLRAALVDELMQDC